MGNVLNIRVSEAMIDFLDSMIASRINPPKRAALARQLIEDGIQRWRAERDAGAHKEHLAARRLAMIERAKRRQEVRPNRAPPPRQRQPMFRPKGREDWDDDEAAAFFRALPLEARATLMPSEDDPMTYVERPK